MNATLYRLLPSCAMLRIAIPICLVAIFTTSEAARQRACPSGEYTSAEKKQNGWKGVLTLACAKEIMASGRLPDPWIVGYIISDDRVKAFLLSGNQNLMISSSIIEGGLAVDSHSMKPRDADLALRLKKRLGGREAPVGSFNASISIIDSTIWPKKNGYGLWLNDLHIAGTLNIARSEIHGPINLTESVFETLRVSETEVHDRMDFSNSIALEPVLVDAGFSHVTFHGEADFSRSVFAFSRTPFHHVTFKEAADFQYAHFEKSTNWRGTVFQSDVAFDFSKFGNRVDFRDTKFLGDATFAKTKYAHDADFSGATFAGVALFSLGEFNKSLRLRQTEFRTLADFRDITAKSLDWDNSGARKAIAAQVDFRGAEIGDFILANTRFDEALTMDAAILGSTQDGPSNPKVIFRDLEFKQATRMRSVDFRSHTEFSGIRFDNGADFFQAKFPRAAGGSPHSIYLGDIEFGKSLLEWRQLPPLDEWAPTPTPPATHKLLTPPVRRQPNPLANPRSVQLTLFRELEATFRAQGNLDDANAVHYEFERLQVSEYKSKGFFGYLAYLGAATFWGLPAGYGTSLDRVLILALVLLLVTTAAIRRLSHVREEVKSSTSADGKVGLYLRESPTLLLSDPQPAAQVVSGHQTLLAMQVASLVLLKVGRLNLRITPIRSRRVLVAVLWVAWVLGYYLLAIFVVTMTNTQPVIHGLVKSLF